MKRGIAVMLFLGVVLSGCEDTSGSGSGSDALGTLVSTQAEPAGDNCPFGGVAIHTGADVNGNGVLDATEVKSTSYVCNGESGQDGTDGQDALIKTTAEPAGGNCPAGGTRIDSGTDDNGNGVLDPDEIDSTSYVCNGVDGQAQTTLVSVVAEPAGSNCPAGGQAIRTGVDTNADGMLQPGEVQSTSYVCNGTDGLTTLVRQEDAGAGDCAYGGRLVHSGLDLDGNGYLDEGEITQTSVVCNGEPGEPGFDSLFAMTDEPAGGVCSAGGYRIDTGLDSNRNGVLDSGEVTATRYVCNGEAGADGADGHSALVETTAEPAGGNCPAGGYRIDSGVDLDDDGVLDASEITSTRYVCNGKAGADGADGHGALVETTEEPAGSNCPAGGYKIGTGTDTDDDGVLDASEITSTRYVCHGGNMVMRATNAEWGGVCPRGGVKIETGVDDDGDGQLDDSEVDHTQYVCNLYIVQIAAGYYHTCALISDGTVRCWGDNNKGQLGDGSTQDRHTLVEVVGITNAVQISAGWYHTCAVISDGHAKCWGYNYYGQLGDGSTTTRHTPVEVVGITTAKQVSARGAHTCAALSDGHAKCWGGNVAGQLGDGSTTDRHTPVEVVGITTAKQVSAGEYHTCAVLTDGHAKCWGLNNHGQLGDGSTTDRYTPVEVDGLMNVKQVSAGYNHTCAVLTDGHAKCWGNNWYGQLGDGSTTERHTPVEVAGITNASQVSAGSYHTCAVLTDGHAKCWGNNWYGQLGDGSTTERHTPVYVVGIETPVQVSAGDWHTCAMLSDGHAKCWGHNNSGQLGDGSTTDSATPVYVPWDFAP